MGMLRHLCAQEVCDDVNRRVETECMADIWILCKELLHDFVHSLFIVHVQVDINNLDTRIVLFHVLTEAHLTIHLLATSHTPLSQHFEESHLFGFGISGKRHDTSGKGSALQRILTIENTVIELWPVWIKQSVWNFTLIQLRRELRHDVIVKNRADDNRVRIGIQQALTFQLKRFRVERVVSEHLKGNLEIVKTAHTI